MDGGVAFAMPALILTAERLRFAGRPRAVYACSATPPPPEITQHLCVSEAPWRPR